MAQGQTTAAVTPEQVADMLARMQEMQTRLEAAEQTTTQLLAEKAQRERMESLPVVIDADSHGRGWLTVYGRKVGDNAKPVGSAILSRELWAHLKANYDLIDSAFADAGIKFVYECSQAELDARDAARKNVREQRKAAKGNGASTVTSRSMNDADKAAFGLSNAELAAAQAGIDSDDD